MNKVMFSLAIADLLVGIVLIPQAVHEFYISSKEFPESMCRCEIFKNYKFTKLTNVCFALIPKYIFPFFSDMSQNALQFLANYQLSPNYRHYYVT